MKKYIIITTVILFALMCSFTSILYHQLNDCVEQLKQAENNTKALLLSQDSLTNNNRTLQLSIAQLNYYNDSISKALKYSIKELKLKDTEISQLQYLLSTNIKTDTLVFKDTLFVNNVNIDTTTTDNRWYSINLKIKSPNTLIATPSFNNEIITVFHAKKETINPPKKCFIGRWFQKKQIVTETTIINNNPYSTVDTTRIIEIVKL